MRKADLVFGGCVLLGLALMTLSVRIGAIAMGLAFAGAALGRRAGVAGELLASRRRKVDIAVLATFAVALITLAVALPR